MMTNLDPGRALRIWLGVIYSLGSIVLGTSFPSPSPHRHLAAPPTTTMAASLAPPMPLQSLVTDLSADFAQTTNLPHEEAITVAELWGQNTSLGANSIIPQFGKTRKHIFRSIKQTLKERRMTYIDVLQYHISDPNEPLAETMRALNDVVEAGYVRYVAVSSHYVWQLRTMRVFGITNRLTPFVSFQERSSSAFLEEESRVSPLFDTFANEFSRPLRPLEKTIVFESLA